MQRKSVKRRNVARHAANLEAHFGDLAAFVRLLPCVVCARPSWSEPHHVRNRRMWGAWINGCVGNLVPLCREHHDELHDHGARTFEAAHGVDLGDEAARIGEQFKAGADPCPIPW